MKKIFLLIISFFFLLFPVKAVEFNLYSKNALLYNLDEEKVLFEKNSQDKVSIASLTKIMTAIVAIENISDLDEQVSLLAIDFDSLVEANASVAGFKIGQKVTYRDLLYGLLLPSGADAAQALTRLIAGNRQNFVALMNEKAKSLGMYNTNFENETGLDTLNNYSTASDVAIMFKYALKNATLKEIMTTEKYQTSDKTITLRSTINIFKVAYNLDMDYLLGGKTGTTSKAGRCLASLANYNGTNYIFITLGANVSSKPETMLDAKEVYTYFMNNYENKNILTKQDKILTLTTKYAKEKTIDFYVSENIIKYVPKDFQKDDLTIEYEGIKEIPFNTKKGEKLGSITISYDNELLKKEDIILQYNLTFDLNGYLQDHYILIIGSLSIIIFFVILIFYKIFKNKKVN